SPSPEVQAELDSVTSVLRLAQRRSGEAIARATYARSYYESTGRAADALGARHIIALALRARGDTLSALSELTAASADYDRVLGPTHPLSLHVRIHVAEAALDAQLAQRALEVLDD